MKNEVVSVGISQVDTNGRHRKNMGDVVALARSIQEIGLLHPIVVTGNFGKWKLIAGERRLAAFRYLNQTVGGRDFLNIPATIAENLDDVLSALKAERDENVCRKDFSPSEAVEMAATIEPMEREAARNRQGQRTDKHPENFPESSGRASDKTAEAVGMSRPTLEKAKRVYEAAVSFPASFGDLLSKMDETGKVDRVYKELKDREKREQVEEFTRAQEDAQSLEKTYSVIYADPPWQYSNSITSWGPATLHYSTMPTSSICLLLDSVGVKVADNAVLFLWATNPLLEDALQVIKAWGFEYKTNIVWVKTNLERPGSGFYVRGRHEMLFICTKGSFTPLDKNIAPPIGSVIESPVQEHSKKPEVAYEIIERLYPGCSMIELFARGTARDGWDTWGNEAG